MSREFFEMLRAMRARRKTAMKKGPIALLDIGSTKTACLIVQFLGQNDTSQQVEIGSKASFIVKGQAVVATQGMRAGEVVSMIALEQSILMAVEKAQKNANLRADYAIICLSGGQPQSYSTSGETVVRDGEVSELDIGAALAACEFPILDEGREFIHAMPVNFSLDHQHGLLDPRGQVGAQLSVDMHLLSVKEAIIHNLVHLVHNAHMELIGVTVSGFMSGLSCLTSDEQEIGAAVVDLGGQTSSVAIFLRKQLVYASSIRMGGDHITSDIAQGLRLPKKDAERLKTFHGGVEATTHDDREELELPQSEGIEGHGYHFVTRAELISIIRPRVEEILEAVRDELLNAGFDQLMSQRVVLTGGGSQLTGIESLAEHYFGARVRAGVPVRLASLAQNHAGPSFSALIGLGLYVASPRDEMWDFQTPYDQQNRQSFKKMFSWFRENF